MENKIIIQTLICILEGISLNNTLISNNDLDIDKETIKKLNKNYIKYNERCIKLLEQFLIKGDDYVSKTKKS